MLQELADQGLRRSPGTIREDSGNCSRCWSGAGAIRSLQLSEDRAADETGWRVFVEVEGKAGQGWHLGLFRSPSTVLFTLSPSRSAPVPEAHFAADAAGILLSGR